MGYYKIVINNNHNNSNNHNPTNWDKNKNDIMGNSKNKSLLMIILTTIALLTIITQTTPAASASINCTYGVDFQNNSVWTITGNNITICDHENLILNNVSIILSNNGTLILNNTNLTINNSKKVFSTISDNGVLRIINRSNFTSKITYFNITDNGLLESYDSALYTGAITLNNNSQLLINNNSYYQTTDGGVGKILLHDTSSLIMINAQGSGTTAYDNATISMKNNQILGYLIISGGEGLELNESTITNILITGDSQRVFNNLNKINLTITNLRESIYSTGSIISDNDLNIAFKDLRTYHFYLENISADNLIVKNSTIEHLLRISAEELLTNASIMSINNSNLSSTTIIGGEYTFLGDNNTLENFTIGESTTPVVTRINGNLTPQNYLYNATNNSINRSYLVRLERPVSGYEVCVLENLTNTSDCYYTNTSNNDGEATVYLYFQNSTDTDYLYIQYQDEPFLASNTSNYLINSRADITGPSINITLSDENIYANNFRITISGTDVTASNYSITQGARTWAESNLTINNSNPTENLDFEGIFLPTGNWNITVRAVDEYQNPTVIINQSLTSFPAVFTELTGDDEQSGYVGGNNITFTFNITLKGYPWLRAFLNLTNGDYYFDTYYAAINNGTDEVRPSRYSDYSGSGRLSLPLIDDDELPEYVLLTASELGEIYQLEDLQLILEPYNGLSAGGYSGTYGFGLDDGS